MLHTTTITFQDNKFLNRIIENEKEKEGNYPEEFYQQIVCLAEDMWECIKDFIEKSVEKYDGKEILDGHDYIQDIDIKDYGMLPTLLCEIS